MAFEGIAAILGHIPDIFHRTTAGIADTLPNVGAVAGEQLTGSTSNGVGLVNEKTHAFKKARIRHKYALRVVRMMLRNSLRNKARIMVPGFAASLLVPQPVLQAMQPVFALFGAHLGMEAAHDVKHALTKRAHRKTATHHRGDLPDPQRVLNTKIPTKTSLRHVLHKANDVDRTTTMEITAAVLGSIDTLPVAQQLPIMAVYVAGMTAGVYGTTTALVKMEDWGQRLETWQPRHPLAKALADTSFPARVGVAIQQAAPKIFGAMPWVGAAAKFVTSGRVISHAAPAVEHMIEHSAHTVTQHLSPLGGDATTMAATVTAWGLVGIGAGIGTQAAHRVVYKPVKDMVLRTGLPEKWRRTASATLINVALMKAPPPRHKARSARHGTHIVSQRPGSYAGSPPVHPVGVRM